MNNKNDNHKDEKWRVKMKLAEALILRAEYRTKLENLKQRILNNVKVQEGEKPVEAPQQLLTDFEETNKKLKELIKQINHCNERETLQDGRTLSEALVDREAIIKERQMLATVVSDASERDYRMSHTEIKFVVTMNISDIQKKIDELSKEFRMLDTEIQSKNWLVNL